MDVTVYSNAKMNTFVYLELRLKLKMVKMSTCAL